MAEKYLKNQGGMFAEKEALTVSAGSADAGKIFAPGADGRWSTTLMPIGIVPETKTLIASEALAAGDFVNVWNDTGVAKVRKADASTIGKIAHGFVLAGSLLGETATVYLEATNTQLSRLTAGANYFLSAAVPGGCYCYFSSRFWASITKTWYCSKCNRDQV